MSNDNTKKPNPENLPAALPDGDEWFRALGISGIGTSGPIPGEVIHGRVKGFDYICIDTGNDAENQRIISEKEADGWLHVDDPRVQQGHVHYGHQSAKATVLTMRIGAHKILQARKEQHNATMDKRRMGELKSGPAGKTKDVNYSATFTKERG
jgi:hypothetical protein